MYLQLKWKRDAQLKPQISHCNIVGCGCWVPVTAAADKPLVDIPIVDCDTNVDEVLVGGCCGPCPGGRYTIWLCWVAAGGTVVVVVVVGDDTMIPLASFIIFSSSRNDATRFASSDGAGGWSTISSLPASTSICSSTSVFTDRLSFMMTSGDCFDSKKCVCKRLKNKHATVKAGCISCDDKHCFGYVDNRKEHIMRL